MNIGQVLETHLGMAANGIGVKIDRMLKEQGQMSKLRSFLKEVYGAGKTHQVVDLRQFQR